jgi:hypothetical protein
MVAARRDGDPQVVGREVTERLQRFHIVPGLNELKKQHTINYEGAMGGDNASPDIRNLYTDPHVKLFVPFGNGWTVSANSYWTLMNSVVRRFVQASNCNVTELRDANLDFNSISENKKQISFM